MSIPLDPARLADALTDFDGGYLLTVGEDGQIKAVAAEPTADAGTLTVTGPGHGSATNIVGSPQVTVLLPPMEHHGYSLIIDGSATGNSERIDVAVTGAVLHRPASYADGPVPGDGCGQDCQRLA